MIEFSATIQTTMSPTVISSDIPGELSASMRYVGNELQRAVVRHASGRPGPEIQTGYYVSTIGLEFEGSGYLQDAVVFSDAPQAHRLEYGYSGVDANGRAQFTPPYPHFRPALDEVEQMAVQELSAVRIV